jgi:hypothetical protein
MYLPPIVVKHRFGGAIGALRCHQTHRQIRETRFINVGSAAKGGSPMITAKERCRLRTAAARVGVALIACMIVAITASAQSTPAVFQAVRAGSAVQKQLFAASQNLRQMRGALASPERDWVSNLLSAEDNFQGILSEELTVGRILTEMRSAEDLKTVRLYYFGHSSLAVVSTADADIELINMCLVNIATPAALAEATKIRDVMIEGRNIFRPFATRN